MHNTEIVVVMGINIENGGEDTMYKEVGAKAPSQFRLHTYTHIFMSLGPPQSTLPTTSTSVLFFLEYTHVPI